MFHGLQIITNLELKFNTAKYSSFGRNRNKRPDGQTRAKMHFARSKFMSQRSQADPGKNPVKCVVKSLEPH